MTTAQTLDDLDDWSAANSPSQIRELRRIRQREDQGGKGKDLRELLKRWPIK